MTRSEEHTSELQSLRHLVCRLLLEKKQFAASFNLVKEPVAVHCRHPCVVVFQAEPDEEWNLKRLPVAWTIDIQQSSVFFFNDTATTEIYTLSLHDALPI